MTIPTRPAPAPPGSRAQNAAAGANATLQQLRLQLQQQQEEQRANGGIQKLPIKLPPPPKGHVIITNNNQHNNSGSHTNCITRKFPQARYTPVTDWDDAAFANSTTSSTTTNTNGNYKKVPPPRPPPPRVQVNGRKQISAPAPPSSHGANLITNIFHRKKPNVKASNNHAAAVAAAAAASSRIYGVSSGFSGNNSTVSASATTHITTNSYTSNKTSNSTAAAVDWNAAWNSTANISYSASSVSTVTTTRSSVQDVQLITFDSPPSSPTFTQKSNSDCVSVDSFSSDSNFSSPNNGSVSQPESGFEDDFSASRSRPPTTSPLDPWETLDTFGTESAGTYSNAVASSIGTAPVRNLYQANARPTTTTSAITNNDNPLCNGKSLLPPPTSLTVPTIIKPKISQKPKAPNPPALLAKHVQSSNFSDSQQTPPSPPMPDCPPPPAPMGFSLLDVISGKVDAIHLSSAGLDSDDTSPPYGIALYDFNGTEDGDLAFRENEKIYLLEQVSAEWYRGRTRSGCEGIFPANYIDIKVPLTAPATDQQSPVMPVMRCLYNFPAEVEGDLPLKENDFVTVLYRINEDWLFGEINGSQGQFPANFLEYVPDNLPMP